MNTYTYTYNETHRVIFGNDSIGFKDTWNDWSLIPSDRPVFALPSLKTNFVDIPGGNGSIDLTTVLTEYPIYENRTGSLDFIVIEDPKRTTKTWTERITEISRFLNSQAMYAELSDDPGYLYKGRFYVTNWDNGDQYSTITIEYNVHPFKLTKQVWTSSVKIESSLSQSLITNDPEIQEIVFDTFEVTDSDNMSCSIDNRQSYIRLYNGLNHVPSVRTNTGGGTVYYRGIGYNTVKFRGGKL